MQTFDVSYGAARYKSLVPVLLELTCDKRQHQDYQKADAASDGLGVESLGFGYAFLLGCNRARSLQRRVKELSTWFDGLLACPRPMLGARSKMRIKRVESHSD